MASFVVSFGAGLLGHIVQLHTYVGEGVHNKQAVVIKNPENQNCDGAVYYLKYSKQITSFIVFFAVLHCTTTFNHDLMTCGFVALVPDDKWR